MPNSDVRNMFGLAMTAVYARSVSYSAITANKMCQAVAQGFDLSTTDGDTIYSYFNTESRPDASSVFLSTPYTTYEGNILAILQAYLPTASTNQAELLAVAAHAVIFGYTLNASINLTDLQKLIGEVLKSVSSIVLETDFFRTENRVVITPFSSYSVIRSVLQNDYSQTVRTFSAEEQTIEVPLTNYNWYDASALFKGPDLQIMKDVENQYYYLSGQMIFQSAFGAVETCIEDTATIDTWSGQATFTYYRNTPCRENDSYIGPPNSVLFNRVFNDGPSSSGYFTTGLSGFYIQNDKAVLNSRSYLANTKNLFTTTGSALCSNAYIDANGEYSLLQGDYLNAPYSFGCTEPYQRLHIGDNRARYICNPNTCVCTLRSVTGFKFVSLSLPDNDETSDWQFRQTNPLSEESRILIRALNVADNPYRATDVGGELYPYVNDVSPPFSPLWNIGYPLLNGGNTLPELAFFQTFDSPTFSDGASVTIFPCLAASAAAVGETAESDRTYTLGSKMMFSGGGSLPIQFNEQIPSNLSGHDRTTQKFFGMGTAFSGKYNIDVVAEENAGFFYSGFSVFENGTYINASTLADAFLESTVGRLYSNIKHISGYRRLADGATFGLSNFYAKDGSGNLYTYNYFNQTDVPMVNIQQDNWSYFAPAPSQFENTAIYEKVYEDQTPENYLPRFYDGPFSQETRKFLYPNAVEVDKIYGGKTRGIPKRIRFKVNIREEAVKEIYGKFTIYPDGTISETAEQLHVIRSDVMGNRVENPKMQHMFVPNGVGDQYDYDFNNWGADKAFNTIAYMPDVMVDRLWAPLTLTGGYYYVPSGRNSDEYYSPSYATSLFTMGLKKTSDGAQTHIYRITGVEGFSYTPHKVNDALFHAFEFSSFSGMLAYALPIFNLETNVMDVNQGILDGFPTTIDNLSLDYTSYNGFNSGIDSGRDPLFLELIGGRRGSASAANEGGYHSKEIVGDRYVGMVFDTFGTRESTCYRDGNTFTHEYRFPQNDQKLALFNTDASGTDIWINGMSFSPYTITRNTSPLNPATQIPVSVDGLVGVLPTWTSGEFINFDLGVYFPLSLRGLDPSVVEHYFESGLFIGPFDRDVEIGISAGERIVAYSEFYLNDRQLSHWFYGATNCDRDWVQNICIGQFVQPGEPFYSGPRRSNYSILSVIPSGQRAKFNIISDVTYGIEGDPAMSSIGLASEVVLSLKTHIPLDTDAYAEELYSGEQGRLEPFGYVNNGVPHKYRIEHDSFENMAGIREFVNYGYSGRLYPKPNETEYRALASVDTNGNIVYPSNVNPETYWRAHALKHNTRVYFSGYREGSRISFEFHDIQLEYDTLPYQSYNLVVPSGRCILSGEMGYYAQADNSVFTEGIYLKSTTQNDDFADTYNPSFVSDVLRRVPSGVFPFPVTLSGSGHAPVLQAPSVMKQREYISGISEGQNYSYLFRQPDYNYNKLLWPALSDLETLNAGETLESVPPGDGNTFTNSTMLFSACQGQMLPNGTANPIIEKKYSVQNIFQFYDSVATDALINSGRCLTSGRGNYVELSQKTSLSGALVPRGSSLSLVLQGLV